MFLQFDVVAYRLKHEYRVECAYEAVNIAAARWVSADDNKQLKEFQHRVTLNLAHDAKENLIYLAPSQVNLKLTMERWPDICFSQLKEI